MKFQRNLLCFHNENIKKWMVFLVLFWSKVQGFAPFFQKKNVQGCDIMFEIQKFFEAFYSINISTPETLFWSNHDNKYLFPFPSMQRNKVDRFLHSFPNVIFQRGPFRATPVILVQAIFFLIMKLFYVFLIHCTWCRWSYFTTCKIMILHHIDKFENINCTDSNILPIL